MAKERLSIGGFAELLCVNPDGSVAWRGFWKNGVVNVALNDVLEVYLRAGTQKTQWFMGLINESGFSAIAATDTMASHPGWSELTSYTASTRPQWIPAAASGQQMSNAATVDFAINASADIRGIFLASDSTKGGTGGLLFCTAISGSAQSMGSGQTLKVTYTCPLTAT